MLIFPSVASSDVLRIANEIDRLQGWPYIHFDIEDGHFTPNMTFGQKMLRSVSNYIAPRKLDVHLMADDPMAWLPVLQECGVESVCAHIEALKFPLLFLNTAKNMGMKAGLALNIGTELSAVVPFADAMDTLLVMTAEPDGNGEMLNRYALNKAITAAKTLPMRVMADGALNLPALEELHEAGAYGCVLGRLIFKAEDSFQTLNQLNKQFGQ